MAYYANPVTGEVEKHDLSDATWAEVKAGHPVGGARVMNGEEDLWTLEAPDSEPPPAGPPVNVDVPYAMGPTGQATAFVAETVTVTMGNWQNAPDTYEYLWKRRDANGQVNALPGATTPSYVTTEQDKNKFVFCALLATNAAGQGFVESNEVAIAPRQDEMATGSRR